MVIFLKKLQTKDNLLKYTATVVDNIYCLSLMNCVLLSFVVIRWEEERSTDGSKWRFLEHKGPVFAPPYEPLPDRVKFYYDGKSV